MSRPIKQSFSRITTKKNVGRCAPICSERSIVGPARLRDASIANFLSHAPGLRQLLGLTLGLAPQRQIPRLASVNFQQWALRERPQVFEKQQRDSEKPEVLLWVDTFNNYFHPETSRALSKSWSTQASQ